MASPFAVDVPVTRRLDELDDIDAQLELIETQLALLQGRRNALQGTHGIPPLPEELLAMIFEMSLPEYPTLDHLEAPLLLTQVCRRWRRTAHHTSCLWSNIHITIPALREPRQGLRTVRGTLCEETRMRFANIGRSFTSAVGDWLTHVGGLPLSIAVEQHDFLQKEEDTIFIGVLDTLLQRSKTWTHLDIRAPLRNARHLIERPQDDFPILRSVSIYCTSRSPHHPSPPLLEWRGAGMLNAPQLHSLDLFRVDEPLLSFNVNWSGLKSLTIEKQGTLGHFGSVRPDIVVDVPTTISLLRQCLQLEHLRISLTPGAKPPESPPTSPLTLPRLTSLTFYEDRSSSWDFFDTLNAPCLRSIEFQTLRKADDGRCSLLPFAQRQGSTIEELTIDTQYISPHDRSELFKSLTRLTTLALRRSDFAFVPSIAGTAEQGLLPFTDDDLRTFLPSQETQTIPCPHLTTLVCETLSKVTDTGLLDFLRGRAGVTSVSLACVTTRQRRGSVDEELRALQRRDPAMQLAIEYEYKAKFVSPWTATRLSVTNESPRRIHGIL